MRIAESVDELLSVDSSSTLVSRRRAICRILSVTVLHDQLVCVLDNGVVEVFRCGMSPRAKTNINIIQAKTNGRSRRQDQSADPHSADSSEDASVCNLMYRRSHFMQAYKTQAPGRGKKQSSSATSSARQIDDATTR